MRYLNAIAIAGLLTWVAVVCGCSKSAEDPLTSATPLQPKEAASHLEQAFATATPELRETATTASQALQTADYTRAVQTIYTIKKRPDLSFEQGLAIHASEVALEAKLIAGVQAGDPAAKQAYERLKQNRRD